MPTQTSLPHRRTWSLLARGTVCLLLLSSALLLGASSTVSSDEEVILFPTLALPQADGQVELQVHGWIYEPEAELARAVPHSATLTSWLTADAFEPANCEHFAERSAPFLVDNEGGKTLTVTAEGQQQVLPPSDEDGHFQGKLTLKVAPPSGGKPSGPIHVSILRSSDQRSFEGHAYRLEPQGLSVVSDLDDTIKVSRVNNKEELMRNTFCRTFRAVPGMVELYRGWHKRLNASFHYVTASPWQLYGALAGFARDSGFPGGTWHMKRFRLWDRSALNLLEPQKDYKLSQITPLIESFPQRTFVLVGDSGEQDPEVYGELARRYPKQIKRIFIRDVTGEPRSETRFQQAFRGLPDALWTVFWDPKTIQNSI